VKDSINILIVMKNVVLVNTLEITKNIHLVIILVLWETGGVSFNLLPFLIVPSLSRHAAQRLAASGRNGLCRLTFVRKNILHP
jgi:hypothetical protein